MRVAVVLFNLGGPGSLEAVEPFLTNLFSDPAVIDLPAFLRRPVARFVARRRAPTARAIYARIGGRSPILENTQSQADALERLLRTRGVEARCLISMRCAPPSSARAAQAVKEWDAERIVLLPLYPQASTTTTRSSIADWVRTSERASLKAEVSTVCCFPENAGFVEALAELVHRTLTRRKVNVDYRLLLSAHGLPERTIAKGDPYRWQVERTAKVLVDRLGMNDLDWRLCFQSRVGPLRWIGPATDSEIRRAGAEGKGLVVAPIAFVSEHAETLVELDMDYARLAQDSGVPDYLRVPAVGTHTRFIEGLGDLVVAALADKNAVLCGSPPLCPQQFRFCGCRESWA